MTIYFDFKNPFAGAELMEEMEQKTAKEQEDQERQILEKIKLKMDRIKASQQKIQGALYDENMTHYVGELQMD